MNPDLSKRQNFYKNYLQALPGLLAWFVFIGLFVFSFYTPMIVASLLIFYVWYWLIRTIGFAYRIMASFFHIQKDTVIFWNEMQKSLTEDPKEFLYYLESKHYALKSNIMLEKNGIISFLIKPLVFMYLFFFKKNLLTKYVENKELIAITKTYISSPFPLQKTNHLLIIPTYKEPLSVLIPTFAHIAESTFDKSRLHIILAGELADKKFGETKKEIQRIFGGVLPNLYTTQHILKPGETPGKSSNQAYAIKWFDQNILPNLDIDTENLLVTSLDADYRMHPEYFSYLSLKYAVDLQRKYHIFQPIPMFLNNIWKVNIFSRLSATLSSQIQMSRQSQKQRNRNFSSYSMSYQTTKDAGFWDPHVIQEDSRLFWKIFFQFGDKNVHVEPLYLPVLGDAIHSHTYTKSLQELYIQMRRWAWGASDIPYVIVRAFASKKLSWQKKTYIIFRVIADYFNWVTMPIILSVGSLLPLLLNKEFSNSVLGYNLPRITSFLLTITLFAIFVFLFVDTHLTPRTKDLSTARRFSTYGQWFLMPLMGIVFAALPALDAQTRLMIKKPIQYKVVEKGL